MNETEWDSLSELWVSSPQAIDADALKRVAAAHRRRLVLNSLGEVAFIIGLAWLTRVVLRDGIEAWELVWTVTLWAFMAAALAFAWWNRRGTWRALGDSVADYIHLTRTRAERQRRSLWFGIALFVAEVVVIIAQLKWFDRLTGTALILLGASAVIVASWVIVARRKIERDLAIVKQYEQDGNL